LEGPANSVAWLFFLGRSIALCFLRGRLKSLSDDFRKPLGHRNGTHVDNKFINFAICVEVYLINRLKLLAFDLASKPRKYQLFPASAVKVHLIPGAVLATSLRIRDAVFAG